jgi:peroxiredoxin family protein
MAKSRRRLTRTAETISDMPAMARSLKTMSDAFAAWARKANRAQAEAIRFLSDQFNKDIEMMLELSACKNRKDVFGLRPDFASSLVDEYIAEGTRLFALHNEDVNPESYTLSKPTNAKLQCGMTALGDQ